MMVNSLVTTTISHYGLDRKSPLEARRKAGLLFSQALNRGKRRSFWRKLFGKGNQLLELALEAKNAKRQPTRQKGAVQVPINKIVGSEGRTHDFDSAFLPLTDHIRDRWIGIAAARRRGTVLPPVDLIQVGDAYFVRDGHHRISVAKAAGQIEIEAQILYVLVE